MLRPAAGLNGLQAGPQTSPSRSRSDSRSTPLPIAPSRWSSSPSLATGPEGAPDEAVSERTRLSVDPDKKKRRHSIAVPRLSLSDDETAESGVTAAFAATRVAGKAARRDPRQPPGGDPLGDPAWQGGGAMSARGDFVAPHVLVEEWDRRRNSLDGEVFRVGSVLEGRGAKLTGRRSMQLRDAIMRQTGFLELHTPPGRHDLSSAEERR